MNMDKLLCPSMMCADFDNLKEDVFSLDAAGTDIFHCDVMDGSFVPNITLGLQDVKCIRKNTKKLVDCHLMIENPGTKIDLFIDAGADLIYIHPESERYVVKTLNYIKEKGKLAGIAINPDTSIETVQEMLHFCDYVLIMSVSPGFAGQKYIEFVTQKIKRLCELKHEMRFKVIVDGGCSVQKIKELSEIGVDGFVLGTSALFNKSESYECIMRKLKEM